MTRKKDETFGEFGSVTRFGHFGIDVWNLFFFKMGHSWSHFNLFSSLETNSTFLIQLFVKKCPSSIQCRDSNPRPSDSESLPKTSGQGLPPILLTFWGFIMNRVPLLNEHLVLRRVPVWPDLAKFRNHFEILGKVLVLLGQKFYANGHIMKNNEAMSAVPPVSQNTH